MSPYHLGQLRHLYDMMVNGRVKDAARAAEGLLGPAIADEERAQRDARPPAPSALRAESCTRDHLCARPGEGPCNGVPRATPRHHPGHYREG